MQKEKVERSKGAFWWLFGYDGVRHMAKTVTGVGEVGKASGRLRDLFRFLLRRKPVRSETFDEACARLGVDAIGLEAARKYQVTSFLVNGFALAFTVACVVTWMVIDGELLFGAWIWVSMVALLNLSFAARAAHRVWQIDRRDLSGFMTFAKQGPYWPI